MDGTSTLHYYNALMSASDGLEFKCGTISSNFSRFMVWNTKDGKREASHLESKLLTLVKGMVNKELYLTSFAISLFMKPLSAKSR